MDFDLFEFEEDEDLLSCISLEPTQKQQLTENFCCQVVPEFQCTGEDSLAKSQFSTDGFIKNGFINTESNFSLTTDTEITLSAYDFQRTHLRSQSVAQFLFGEACMHLQHLQASVRGLTVGSTDVELSYFQRRRQVTKLLHVVLHSTPPQQWSLLHPHFCRLHGLLNRLTEASNWKSIYFANSCKGNECNVPAYHMLHGALEWKLLDLCILHQYEWDTVSIEERKTSTAYTQQLERTFKDLITCSLYLYAKKKPIELLHTSPFPCTCFKEFWLFLQLALHKWSATEAACEDKLTFWTVFNKVMGKLKTEMAQFCLTPLHYFEFSNWILHALTKMFGYRSNGHFEGPHYTRATAAEAENYDFCEQCMRQFLTLNPSEEQLRVYLCLLTPTLLDWWRCNANVPMLLWEQFHKRLNSACYVAGSSPSNLAVACASGQAYLDRYRTLLREPVDANLGSYTLFTLLLGKTFERLQKAHSEHQAQKLLGRLYSKFSLQKLLTLNETGLHHLIELFLLLGLCGDFRELAPQLRDKLLTIAFDKITSNKQLAVVKGHAALLILGAEHHCEQQDYVKKLLQQLLLIRNDLAVCKVLADALPHIFAHTSDLRGGEQLLIDGWLPHFLNSCTPVEQERTLEALHLLFLKLVDIEASKAELLQALNLHVLPFVKQQFAQNYSAWLPQLAADFCNHTETANFQRLFANFIDAQPANRQALPQFLLIMLRSPQSTLIEPNIIMQVWLKSLVLLPAQNEQVQQLSQHVVQLAVFQRLAAVPATELLQSKEPLCVFVAAVGKQYDSSVVYQERCHITDTFNALVRQFERWIPADKLEKSELTFRFYSFLAIVIYNCPQIVYAKSQISCFFHVAITRFILPNTVQMGKPPEGKLAQLIHKIWPVLVQGIGRLSYKTDPYINRTLTDLIQKWTPHFKISPNSKVVARPFITCLQGDNQDLALFVCEKLTGIFLATQRRLADPNACLVITIFQEIVSAITATPTSTLAPAESAADVSSVQERQLETFMKGTCLLTLEHMMMVDDLVPSRNMLLEHFRLLISCRVYKQSARLQALLAEHLRILTKKHLAYYTFFYFDLLMKLTQLSYELVAPIMDFLLQEVRVVEQNRGVGEDSRIRACLHKLQQAIEAKKHKI